MSKAVLISIRLNWCEKIASGEKTIEVRKTRQSVFLEQYPEAELEIDGVIEICPSRVSATYRRDTGPCVVSNCVGCRREFWMQEVE